MKAKVSAAIIVLLVVSLVGCDQVTKILARAHLADGSLFPILTDFLDLRYAENRDVAFNVLQWVPEDVRKPLLLSIGSIMIAILAGMILYRPAPLRFEQLGLVLILAGAIGNVADRFARGYVVDFIHLHHWPIFNLADVYITVGAVLFILHRLFLRPKASSES